MIEEILEKYCTKLTHAKEVKKYSTMLIDAIYPDSSPVEKNLLEAAALLHDIGYYIEAKAHHKHSLDLILGMEIAGFSEKEVQIIAHTARYHRCAFPDENNHKRYAKLDKEQKETVLKLASILRIADGLDNPHKNLVTGIEYEENETSITIYIRTVGFAPNLKTAETKKDLFEFLHKKPVSILCKKL